MNINYIKDNESFDQMLNELYPIRIGSYEFNASDVLKELDPIAYRCEVADFPDRYQCGECLEIYDDIDEAEDCCKDEEEN